MFIVTGGENIISVLSLRRWNDYNISAGEQITGYGAGNNCVGGVNGCYGSEISLSSWIPLWGGLLPESDGAAERVLASLQSSGLIQEGGVLTTTVPSGQQWDSPNAWPPLVLLTIEGLRAVGLNSANTLAVSLDILTLATLRTLTLRSLYFTCCRMK